MQATCAIPGNLLTIHVDVQIVSYDSKIVHGTEGQAVSIHVVDRSEAEDGARGIVAEAWPGVLRPLLS